MEQVLGLRINRRAIGNEIQFIETEDTFILTVYLPGADEDEIDIVIDNEGTQVSISRRVGRSFRQNLVIGPLGFETKLSGGLFHKVFWIPDGVDVNQIWARIDDGCEVLSIYMPKFLRQEEEPRDTDQESILSESDEEEYEEARDEEFVQDIEDSEQEHSLKQEQLDFKEIMIEDILMNNGEEDYLEVNLYSEESEDEENNLEMDDEEEIPLTPEKDHEEVRDFSIEEIRREVDDSNKNQEEETSAQEENQGSENIKKDSEKSNEPKKDNGTEEAMEKNPGETHEPTLDENEENTFPSTRPDEGNGGESLPLSSEEHGKPEEIFSPSDHIKDEPSQQEQLKDEEASSTTQEPKTENNDPFVDGDEDNLPQPEKHQREESAMPTPEHDPSPDTIKEKEEKSGTTILDQEESLQQKEEPHRIDDTTQKEDQKLSEDKETNPEDLGELDEWVKVNGVSGGWPRWGWRGKRMPQFPSSSLMMGAAFILSLSVLMLHLMKKGKNQQ